MKKIVKKSHQKQLKLQKQQGFGIVSVILGIVASAIIILLGFQQYQQAMMKIKIGSAQTQFQDISTGIDSLYANSHDFSTISTQVVIDAGIASHLHDSDGEPHSLAAIPPGKVARRQKRQQQPQQQ